ncbi:hypothetical protein DIPPA_21416 [Diplonema papillatum]|nr:hypothetical protein DIPPA_21416 [Diplonema papillatum]|eukprot:gene23194-35541_t
MSRCAARQLYKRTLQAAAKLDDPTNHPAKRALLLGLPQSVWHDGAQRTIQMPQKRHEFYAFINEFNQGELFKPMGQSAVQHVRKAWREGDCVMATAFEALRQINLVLKVSEWLPPVQQQQERCKRRAYALRISTKTIAPRPKKRTDPRQPQAQAQWGGCLLVGHPLASLLSPMFHRALILLDPQLKQRNVLTGFIINKSSGRTLGESAHSNWLPRFGGLQKLPVFHGGKEERGLCALHVWGDVPGCRQIAPGVFCSDLHKELEKGDYRGVDALKEKVKGYRAAAAPIRLVMNSCTWKKEELDASLLSNVWLPLEERKKPSAARLPVSTGGKGSGQRTAFASLCFPAVDESVEDSAWKRALDAAGSEVSILTTIPSLRSEFGKSFLKIFERRHNVTVQRLKEQLRLINRKSKKAADIDR